MLETDVEMVTKEWLQAELRSANSKDLVILDCRTSNEYMESHIRSAVNLSIPSIILRRLAAGKIDLKSTIKSLDLRQRIEAGYKMKLFVLYNDCSFTGGSGGEGGNVVGGESTGSEVVDANSIEGGGSSAAGAAAQAATTSSNVQQQQQQQQQQSSTMQLSNLCTADPTTTTTTINVLHRRLKQDGCRVVCLQDGFQSFRDAFPEWCEENSLNQDMESSRGTAHDQLMGLRSLRISTPHSDSACSSSAESSDCESTTHHQLNEAPVEIVPGLYLGNALHSSDSRALQKYNIKYVLNVTSDLPNVFENSGGIQYLQIPITDHYSQDVAIHFPTAIQFIEEARAKGSSVLVHCLAGVSRSVTVTLAYLMHTKSLCLNEAFTLVRDRKPDVAPNFHFMQQLHSFEQQLLSGQNRTLLQTRMQTGDDSGGGDGIGGGGGGGGGGGSGSGIIPMCPQCPASHSRTHNHHHHHHHHHHQFTSCVCSTESECKCMQTDYLASVCKTVGVSPDSGIEFDRWTTPESGLQ